MKGNLPKTRLWKRRASSEYGCSLTGRLRRLRQWPSSSQRKAQPRRDPGLGLGLGHPHHDKHWTSYLTTATTLCRSIRRRSFQSLHRSLPYQPPRVEIRLLLPLRNERRDHGRGANQHPGAMGKVTRGVNLRFPLGTALCSWIIDNGTLEILGWRRRLGWETSYAGRFWRSLDSP